MSVFVSLLRGINVGGNKKIKMADLRDLYESLGFTGTQTLLQSGNAVFAAQMTDPEEVARHIEKGIIKRFGFESRIIIRTEDELKGVVANHPFSEAQISDPKKILVFFLDQVPDAEGIKRLHEDHKGVEEINVVGRDVYIFYPDGMGRSKLDNTFMERRLKCTGTGRNWNTVNKLLDLLSRFES